MKNIYLLLTAILISFSVTTFAQSSSIQAIDTIAGYSSIIKSKDLPVSSNVSFKVEKPDGENIFIQGQTDVDGNAEAELYGYHTKKSGIYNVSISTAGEIYTALTQFEVYPDEFSSTKSEIMSDTNTVSAVIDELIVEIHVKDKYENPLPGQLIKLISSRSEDFIESLNNGLSNKEGIVRFKISSNQEGNSVLTAINQVVGKEIQNRKDLIFYSQEESMAIGGDDFSADTFSTNDSFGVLDHFEIEYPNEVVINDEQNLLAITARDKDGNIVRSYTGTIAIVINGDDNAIIPNNGQYSFTEKDQGEKEFSLALIFKELGDKSIEVFDMEDGQINKNLRGEKNLNVVKKAAIDGPDPSGNDKYKVSIKFPVNNSVLGSSTLTVSGMGVPNSNLKLMLNESKNGTVSVDDEGFFSTTINDIDDGKYVIYVSEEESLRRSSQPVTFTIDASAPKVEKIELSPSDGVLPDTDYTITVYSEPKLDIVKVFVAGMEDKLTESSVTPGKYEVSLVSSKNSGPYNVDVTLADELGNSETYPKQVVLEVLTLVKPDPPIDVLATPGDSLVDITWKAGESERLIDHYNIYLGETKDDLILHSQSKEIHKTLDGLENNKEYYLQISTVDKEKEESERSEITTFKPHAEPIIEPIDTHPVASKMALRAIPGDKKVTLSWDSYMRADFYKISFGIRSKQYESEILTEDSNTSFVLKDLINNLPYYFTVSALDEEGNQISENYKEVRVTPEGFGFQVVQAVKDISADIISQATPTYRNNTIYSKRLNNTGPETWIFLAIPLILTSLFLFLKGRNTNKPVYVEPLEQRPRRVSRKMQF